VEAEAGRDPYSIVASIMKITELNQTLVTKLRLMNYLESINL